jgi:hypothetical protein
LRVAFLTPTLLMDGAERWMISLARCCDRRRIEWAGTALTEGALASAELCREMAAYMPVYAGPGAGPRDGSSSVVRCPSARETRWVLHDSPRLSPAERSARTPPTHRPRSDSATHHDGANPLLSARRPPSGRAAPAAGRARPDPASAARQIRAPPLPRYHAHRQAKRHQEVRPELCKPLI